MYRKIIFLLTLIIIMAVSAVPVLAHGVGFVYKQSNVYEITASYDDGTPLSEAQVTIYAPDDPKNAWKKGMSDENGQYTFSPDTSKTGTWTLQFRKAGHGGTVNIDVGEISSGSASTGLNTIQMFIAALAVVWGFIGTAFYFKKEKK